MKRIRILVADDHPVVRDGLISILGTQPDFEVIGEATTGEEVVEKAASLSPEIVLLDLEMPGMDGLEALEQVRDRLPEVRVIVFTAYDSDERIVGAVRAGAKGYLLKGAPREELFEAIKVVSEGGTLLQPVVASKLMEHVSRPEEERPSHERLTAREMDVMRLLAKGHTNKEIAGKLVISERTVKFHVSSILGKLGAGNRTEAVKIAAQRGVVELK